jgi:serine/threonine-protein phosphatase 5
MKLFKEGQALPKRYVWEIALGAYSIFEKESSLVELTLEGGRDVDVIGDVHGMFGILTPASNSRPMVLFAGQYFDVLKLFQLTGEPTEAHALLMNGDLVDRGSWSVEVILTAFAFKCTFHPNCVISVGLTCTKGYTRRRCILIAGITRRRI